MIDGRETPRRASPGDLGEPSEPRPRRLSRLSIAAPSARRMATTRVGIAVGSLVVLGLVIALVGSKAIDATRQWVHQQPIYQLKFTDIELDPPCPKFIKLGPAGLLEQVRKRAKRPESLSVPAEDAEEIRTDFKHSPWVARADRVAKLTPNRLRVQLVYREPVARIRSTGAYVDAMNVVLPAHEIDVKEVGTLFWIIDEDNLSRIKEGSDKGLVPRLVPGQEHPGVNLRNAALLAGFLKRQMMQLDLKDNPARPVSIHSEHLYVETADRSLLFWGDPPGSEKPGAPTAPEKWAIFGRWAVSPNWKAVKRPKRLLFSKTDLEISDGQASGK